MPREVNLLLRKLKSNRIELWLWRRHHSNSRLPVGRVGGLMLVGRLSLAFVAVDFLAPMPICIVVGVVNPNNNPSAAAGFVDELHLQVLQLVSSEQREGVLLGA